MVSRCKFQSSSEIGAYALLTNSFAILPVSTIDNFFTTQFENALSTEKSFSIIHSSIAGTDIIGRLTVGNKHGLIFPSTATHLEMDLIKNNLPDSVEVAQIEERFSALGNVVSCNDKIALIHPELEQATIDVIQDILQVEAIPAIIGGESLVGSYSCLTNRGGVVCPSCTAEQIQELSELTGLTIEAATVNKGSNLISAGICVNDNCLLCGWETTALEIANLTRIFKIDDSQGKDEGIVDIDESLVDLIL